MKAAQPESPKFDLAASNFPPLPGSVVSVPGESTTEMRLSDVVRGIKATNKVQVPPTLATCAPAASKSARSKWEIYNRQQPASKESSKAEHASPCDAPLEKPAPVAAAACSAAVASSQSR